MQLLTPHEAQALIEFHGRYVGLLCLEDDLVGAAGDHGVEGAAHQRRGDAVVTVGGGHGQHGDVAAEGGGGVRGVGFEFADYDAEEGVVGWVEGLGGNVRNNQLFVWEVGRGGWEEGKGIERRPITM